MRIKKRWLKCLDAAQRQSEKHWNVLESHVKKTLRYHEQKEDQVKEYLEKIADITKERIAYVDETGIDIYLYVSPHSFSGCKHFQVAAGVWVHCRGNSTTIPCG